MSVLFHKTNFRNYFTLQQMDPKSKCYVMLARDVDPRFEFLRGKIKIISSFKDVNYNLVYQK